MKKINYTRFQRVVAWAGLLALVLPLIWLAFTYGKLPDKVPSHFGGAGEADAWSGKESILFLAVSEAVLYLGITGVQKFPQIWNVPGREGDRERAYKECLSLILVVKLLMVLNLSYMLVCSARGTGLGVWFTPVSLVLLFGSMAYYIWKMCRKA